MGVVASNEWSLNKSGRMSKFDCKFNSVYELQDMYINPV